ncbi:hypothetical protein [Catellatospora citrea]|uniref:Mercuric ion transport protein n=1 Tax=Catellatospora citrea TaxID=53366 RepID=A0A8J3KND6_9ACTN|nr:hypothetical protein [Catellatospora citrea]RKE09084.1 hypothetical protein C8E86_3960 [Catellatospora citrea]GIG03022.1 hypothetical protein Cci01nite_81150 [Catellatospora citrea]
MKTTMRRFLPGSLGSLAGIACALCCVIPILLAAGILGGAGWAYLGNIMPGIALALAAFAGLAWWWTNSRRTHTTGCSGGNCSCSQPT